MDEPLNLFPLPGQKTKTKTQNSMNIEQRSGGDTPRAPLDHARYWPKSEGRFSTWLSTCLPIWTSVPHVDMASSSSSRKGIDSAHEPCGHPHGPDSSCAGKQCSLLVRIEREVLNMVENPSFNSDQCSPCKYGGVVVVSSGDRQSARAVRPSSSP